MLKKILPYFLSILLFAGTLATCLYFFEIAKNKEAGKSFRTEAKAELKRVFKVIEHGNPAAFRAYKEFTWFIPGSTVKFNILEGDKVVHEAIYKINEHAFRRGLDTNANTAAEHLVGSGCSFTFGEALPVEKTFLAEMEKQNSALKTYNLGFIGGGLNTALRYLEVADLKKIVKEQDGKYLYIYIDDHLNRWLARPSYLYWAGPDYPHYKVVNRIPKYAGKISSQEEYIKFQAMKKAGLGNTYLHLQGKNAGAPEWSKEELNNFFFSVIALREKYLATFPRGKFYWIIHPVVRHHSDTINYFKKLAAEHRLEILDSTLDFNAFIRSNKLSPEDLQVKYDGHPSPVVNSFFSSWLSKNLKL